MKKKDLTPELIRRATERSTRASMALEGRVVPEGYVRSEGVQRLLDDRRRRIAAEARESKEPLDGHTLDDSIQ